MSFALQPSKYLVVGPNSCVLECTGRNMLEKAYSTSRMLLMGIPQNQIALFPPSTALVLSSKTNQLLFQRGVGCCPTSNWKFIIGERCLPTTTWILTALFFHRIFTLFRYHGLTCIKMLFLKLLRDCGQLLKKAPYSMVEAPTRGVSVLRGSFDISAQSENAYVHSGLLKHGFKIWTLHHR